MNVEMLEELRTHDQGAMEQVARALGHHLAVTADRDLRALRAAMLRTLEPDDDPFVVGFVTALELVARGFEARRESDDEDAAALETASRNPCRKALEVIAENHAIRPTELAKEMGLRANQMTAVLKTLEEAGLISQPPPGDDARTRPRSITPHGRVILQKSNANVSNGPIDRVVGAVVRAMCQLEDGRASQVRLAEVFAESLDTPRARVAMRAFREAMAAAYLGFVDGDASFLVPWVRVKQELQDQLSRAKQVNTAPFVEGLRSLSRDQLLVVRVTAADDSWAHVVRRCDLERVVVVRDDEVTNTRVTDKLAKQAFSVLYASPTTFANDQRSPQAGALFGKALKNYVLGDPKLEELARSMPPGTTVVGAELRVTP